MSWLRNFLKRPPRPVPLHESAEAVEAVDALVDWARVWVRAGYMTRTQIADTLLDMAEDEGLDPELFDADGLVAREIADLKAEQLQWPTVTEWDRLDAALEALDMAGIVARSDFSCCGNCGVGEMDEELNRLEARGGRPRGYVFFHQQDTEAAVRGQGLYFNYGGAVTESDAEHAGIARELVSALEGAGLKPSWNGDLARRVRVDVDWKRRWTE